MRKNYINLTLQAFKEKFKSFLVQRKKVKALENYSEVSSFPYRSHLGLIKLCMDEGFLEQEEECFLDHMINKVNINFLLWSHKTRWLKKEMTEMSKNRPLQTHKQAVAPQQIFMDFSKLEQKNTPAIPVHLLNSNKNKTRARI